MQRSWVRRIQAMSFRSRLLLAFIAVALVPLALFAAGVGREFAERLARRDDVVASSLARDLRRDLDAESAALGARLEALEQTILADYRLRTAIAEGEDLETGELADFVRRATQLTGLSLLQLEDDSGGVLRGSARGDAGPLSARVADALASSDGAVSLIRARSNDRDLLVLARAESLTVGARRATIVGGIAADEMLLRRLVRDAGLSATLITPSEVVASQATSPESQFVAELSLPYIDVAVAPPTIGEARLVLARSGAELEALRGDLFRWIVIATVATLAVALLLALWISTQLSRPIADLARAAASIDLDRLEVTVAADRGDELGILGNRLLAMTRRLHTSAARLRAAERRAAIGDLARQVSHDVKNGLVPIRNVVRHLAEVQERQPSELPGIFADRRETLESSVSYLDTLARGYARLGTTAERQPVEVNGIAREVARAASLDDHVTLHTDLAEQLARVYADPTGLRRILENLVTNAVESLPPEGGTVTIATRSVREGVQLTVMDTGSGMTAEAVARAVDDFFTTKPNGTGLGLSVVRGLVSDLHGTLSIDSRPGDGTTVTITLPAARSSTPAAAPRSPTSGASHSGR